MYMCVSCCCSLLVETLPHIYIYIKTVLPPCIRAGGLLLLSRQGEVAVAFTTQRMVWACVQGCGELVWVSEWWTMESHGIWKFGTWEGPKVAPWKTCTCCVFLWHSFLASVLFWYAHLHFKSLFWGRMKRIWSYPSCRITINGYRSWLFEAMRCFVFTGRTRRFGWWTSKWHWSRLLLEKQKMAFGMWLILIAGHPGLQLKRL